MILESKLQAIKDFQWPRGHWAGDNRLFKDSVDNRHISGFLLKLHHGVYKEDGESLWQAQLNLESVKAHLTHYGRHLLELIYEARRVHYKKLTPVQEYLKL